MMLSDLDPAACPAPRLAPAPCSWENQDEGFVAKLLVPEGAKDIAVGAPVALLVEEAEQVVAFKDYAPGGAPAAAAAEQQAPAAAAGTAAPGGAHHSDRMGPAARTLLAESGIPADLVTPTGPHGIITKGDVLAAMAAGVKAAPPAAAPRPAPAAAAAPAARQAAAAQNVPPAGAAYTDVPNSQIRKVIAQRLLESKQTIPHL